MKIDSAMAGLPWIAREFVKYDQQLGLTPAEDQAKLDHDVRSANVFQRSNPQVMADDILRGGLQSSSVGSSPDGVVIGDAHLGNLGASLNAGVPVFTVTDTTKAGQGPIAYDAVRLASTTLTAADANQFPTSVGAAAAGEALDTYLTELTRYAQTGAEVAPSMTEEEVASADPSDTSGIGAKLEESASQGPSEEVTALTGSPDGTTFLKGRVTDPTQRAALQQAFDAFTSGLQGMSVQALDFMQRLPVGGSNSGLTQTLVLAKVSPATGPSYLQVLELKQLVPPPTETGSGDPQLANASASEADRVVLEGFDDPLCGATELSGKPCVVLPSGDFASLDVSKMTAPQLVAAAGLAGTLVARADEQSVNASDVSDWLQSQGSQAELASSLLNLAGVEAARSQDYVETLAKTLDADSTTASS